jgi:hypothetical protein
MKDMPQFLKQMQKPLAAMMAFYKEVIALKNLTLAKLNKATAIAFKIPTDATTNFPIGTVLTVVSIGVGTTTISAVTPGTTTVASAGAVSASPTLSQWKSAACVKIAANSWVALGAIA